MAGSSVSELPATANPPCLALQLLVLAAHTTRLPYTPSPAQLAGPRKPPPPRPRQPSYLPICFLSSFDHPASAFTPSASPILHLAPLVGVLLMVLRSPPQPHLIVRPPAHPALSFIHLTPPTPLPSPTTRRCVVRSADAAPPFAYSVASWLSSWLSSSGRRCSPPSPTSFPHT
ncbi:hypothetical protein CPC08DRAFT_768819 [Agrocybe pediades]|nr:hypothetical protein CPC08DRAFT_768819 [Agrocybe pediades]